MASNGRRMPYASAPQDPVLHCEPSLEQPLNMAYIGWCSSGRQYFFYVFECHEVPYPHITLRQAKRRERERSCMLSISLNNFIGKWQTLVRTLCLQMILSYRDDMLLEQRKSRKGSSFFNVAHPDVSLESPTWVRHIGIPIRSCSTGRQILPQELHETKVSWVDRWLHHLVYTPWLPDLSK